MKSKILGRLTVIVVCLVISGCATMRYVKPNAQRWAKGNFEATLPIGWVVYNAPGYQLYLTKDGFSLQSIIITFSKTNKELPNTKRKITENMLLQEVSELILDELRLNQAYKNLSLLSNKPVQLGGLDAFRLEFTYNNDIFVKYHKILYGFILSKRYYEIEYTATQQHYYDKSVNDFQSFIDSFRSKVSN